jgi:hypothetical protein
MAIAMELHPDYCTTFLPLRIQGRDEEGPFSSMHGSFSRHLHKYHITSKTKTEAIFMHLKTHTYH